MYETTLNYNDLINTIKYIKKNRIDTTQCKISYYAEGVGYGAKAYDKLSEEEKKYKFVINKSANLACKLWRYTDPENIRHVLNAYAEKNTILNLNIPATTVQLVDYYSKGKPLLLYLSPYATCQIGYSNYTNNHVDSSVYQVSTNIRDLYNFTTTIVYMANSPTEFLYNPASDKMLCVLNDDNENTRLAFKYDASIYTPEEREKFITYRAIKCNEYYFALPHTHKLYNHFDKGNLILFSAADDALQRFSVSEYNQTLVVKNHTDNTNYLRCLFEIMPDYVASKFPDGVIDGNEDEDLQRIIIQCERNILKLKYRPQIAYTTTLNDPLTEFQRHFMAIKDKIRQAALDSIKDKKTKQLIQEINKDNESADTSLSIEVNDVKVTRNELTYNKLSLKYPKIAEYVITYNNNNTDIYEFGGRLFKSIIKQINNSKLNDNNTAFVDNKDWEIIINGMPVVVSINCSNTRRAINGFYINNEELPKVLRNAMCFYDITEFNDYLKDVSKMSLLVRDTLANGLPIKINNIVDLSDYADLSINRIPRILFKQVGSKYYLINKNEELGEEANIRIFRFVEFIRDALKLSNNTDGRYDKALGIYRNGDWCYNKLIHLISEHTTGSDEQIEVGIKSALARARSYTDKAIERSKKLLDEIVAKIDAQDGGDYYTVKGKSTVYRVYKDAPFRVTNNDTGSSICIVDAQKGQGVGYDGLISRLMALKNDTVSVDTINTLAPHV